MNKPKAKLTDVELKEVSFVGAGDNPEAHVVLLKEKKDENKEDMVMTKDDLQAKVDEVEKKLETTTSEKEEAVKEKEELAKQVDELTKTLEELKKETETDDDVADTIDKEKLPESVKKILDEQEQIVKKQTEELAKLKDEQLTKSFISKASGVDKVGKSDEIGTILKEIHKYDADLAEKVFKVFEATHNRLEESGLFKEQGSAEGNDVTVLDKIEQKAEELRKNDPKLTKEQAIVKAYTEDSELKKAYLENK